MKRILILTLCAVFTLMPLFSGGETAIQNENSTVLENALGFIDEHTTVTEHEDGTVIVTLEPVDDGTCEPPKLQENVEIHSATPAYSANGCTYYYTSGQTHTAISIEDRYLYSLLDDDLKEAYRAIDRAARNLEESVELNIPADKLQNTRLYFLYMMDTPELFYLGNTYALSGKGDMSKIFFSYAASATEYCLYNTATPFITEELKTKILAKQALYNAAVNDLISTIPVSAPEAIKERMIYAKILLNSYYNLNAKWNGVCEDNWNAYGIMCNGYGVCESYSESFQHLLNAVGIRCTGIEGYAGGGHKWNAVCIEDEWYQCDITFDDPIGNSPDEAYNYYLNITDEKMAQSHDWSGYEFSVPVCTATKYSGDRFPIIYASDVGVSMHTYLNVCDDTCEHCSYTRYTGGHDYSENGLICKKCHTTRAAGWYWENGKWYYYNESGKLHDQWMRDSVGWVYLGSDGAMMTNSWVRDSIGWCYVGADGYAETNCWKEDSHGWCYLDSEGSMTKNSWLFFDGGWYYLDSDGYAVRNNWVRDSKGWVFLGPDGVMVTNVWARDSVGWCYIGADGYAVTNCWKQDSTGWCYLNSEGSMSISTWIYDNGWYYCDHNGYMVTGWQKIDGTWYNFSSSGLWIS